MAEEKKSKKGCLIAGVIVAASIGAIGFCGIISAIAVPNFLNAVDRGKQKRTMADLRTLGVALETYQLDNRQYPHANNIGQLIDELVPIYLETPLTEDGWERPLLVASRPGGYTICSGGKDGGACTVVGPGGATGSFNDAIIFVDGEFRQWPEGQQN